MTFTGVSADRIYDVQEERRPNAPVVLGVNSTILMDCPLSCMTQESCKSISFGEPATCLIYELQFSEGELVKDKGYKYVNMVTIKAF